MARVRLPHEASYARYQISRAYAESLLLNTLPISDHAAGARSVPRIGLLAALSTNILNMVGVGPFLTIPLVLSSMGGPQAMLGWVAGAVLALCDGLVWAELGAAMPDSGGPFTYLRESLGRESWGRLFGFLFVAQTVVAAPLTAASGAVGFAEYASFLVPGLPPWQLRLLAVSVCLIATVLLYRNIQAVGRFSIALTAVLVATMGWIITSGAMHFQPALAFDFPPHAFQISSPFLLGLGAATLIAMYDFSGYFNVCLIGGEVQNPSVTLPRCILLSIAILAVCYAAMNLSIIGVLPWSVAAASRTVISDFAVRVAGPTVARTITVLILVAAFGSVYAVLLGYSRVLYAAARDGEFFSGFARLHSTKRFPSFSVVSLGIASAAACWLSLDALIRSLLILQILTQFIAQCVGLLLLRRKRPEFARPFSMPLYPLPVLVALGGWVFLLLSSGATYIVAGIATLLLGIGLFLVRARQRREWPWDKLSQMKS